MRGHGNGQRIQRERLALHADVAVFVCGRAAQQACVNGESFVKQKLGAIDVQHLNPTALTARVHATATLAWIDKCAQAHLRDQAWPVRSNVTKQLADHTLRQVVGFDLIL
jgi:hypothetical protein